MPPRHMVMYKMASFKVTITLQSDLSSRELAEFFTALAKSEEGDVAPLMKVLQEAPVAAKPVVVEEQADAVAVPPVTVAVAVAEPAVPVPVPEPPVSDALKKRLMSTEISCEHLNSIIRRHNWARGQKAQIERRWGFSKAACFARIGLHFNDYSLMDGSVSTEEDLRRWVSARNPALKI